jgi:hypothetical protein
MPTPCTTHRRKRPEEKKTTPCTTRPRKKAEREKTPNATRPGKTAKEKTTVFQREKKGNPFKFLVSGVGAVISAKQIFSGPN